MPRKHGRSQFDMRKSVSPKSTIFSPGVMSCRLSSFGQVFWKEKRTRQQTNIYVCKQMQKIHIFHEQHVCRCLFFGASFVSRGLSRTMSSFRSLQSTSARKSSRRTHFYVDHKSQKTNKRFCDMLESLSIKFCSWQWRLLCWMSEWQKKYDL